MPMARLLHLRGPHLGSGLAIGFGALLLGAGGLLAANAFQAGKQPLPYAYTTTKEEASEATRLLAGAVDGSSAQTIELRSVGQGKLLASGQMLVLPDGEDILVGWRSEIGEPLLRSDISGEEEEKLVAALRKHLPAGSTVYAMPDLSRRLAAMTEATYPLAGANDSATMRLPDLWSGARTAILEEESRWRPATPDKTADKAFKDFLSALDAEDKYGVAHLQVLAGGREAYVILHVRDAFDIGVASPGTLSVGLRDFPSANNVHDVTKLVKNWVNEEGYAAYAVIQRDANAVRAYYLGEDRDKSSLIGQLLPFNSARLGQVAGAVPVFQNGGYWVYRIDPVSGT